MKLSADLTLPEDFPTRRTAIVAKSGGGKTYTAAVLAEEMVRAGHPFYALDPTGAWWGLRSSADGTTAGLPVIVIGGQHGDVALDDQAGPVIADLVVHEPSFYVIDLSDLGTRAAEVRFATAFFDRLYRSKKPKGSALHGFWDEADLFAPQRSGPDEKKMLGAAEHIIRRGRIKGLGTTLITQRPAVINKNVLTQIDLLIALQIVGPQDRKAIREYLDGVADPDTRDEVLTSLASLTLGEAWVYGPGIDPPLYQRTTVRARETFNSSATGGSSTAEPARLADVDLDALRDRLAATIEKAKADDPKALRARIAQLERDLAAAEARTAEPELIEIATVPAEHVEHLHQLHDQAATLAGAATAICDSVERALEQLAEQQVAVRSNTSAPRQQPKATASSNVASRRRDDRPRPAAGNGTPVRAGEGAEDLSPARRRILDALAWFDAIGIPAPTRAALAPMAGSKPTSGGFKNNLGALRTAGLIDYPQPNRVELTADGQGAALYPEIAPTAEQLQDAVRETLTPARRAILDHLIADYPDAATREDLAAAVGVPATSGGFKNNLGALRTLELIDYPQPGTVAALPILFPTGQEA